MNAEPVDQKQVDSKHQENAASFGRAAEAYERGRPSYPSEAVDWLLPESARQVVDLGAGTGKLTRRLLGRGLDVIAVEPSEGMVEQLTLALPGVPAHLGTAENMPLANESADCILVAQAWHWVQPEQALPEVARVLRPGGRLGLLWNLRDVGVAWVQELGRLMRPGGGTMESTDTQELGDLFGPVERFEVRWRHRMTLQELLDMVVSRSYVITGTDQQRIELLDGIRELVSTHPDLAGREWIEMPYVTECFRAARI